MNRSLRLLPACILAAFSLMPVTVNAAPTTGFDLDLKDLRRPALPPVTATKQMVHRRKTHPRTPHERHMKEKSPVPVIAPATVTMTNKDTCSLGSNLLAMVAVTIPPQQVLPGFSDAAMAAARYQGVTALLACGLHPAEAYTLRRLLSVRGVSFISLQGDESATQVIQTVAAGLGIPYRKQRSIPLSYLLYDRHNHPLLLTVTDGTAGGKQ